MKYRIYFLKNENCIFHSFNDIASAIAMSDALVKYKTANKHSLMEDLNTMQTEHYAAIQKKDEVVKEDETVFNNKYTIPLYFVNLVLHKYDLEIRKD